MAASLIGPCFLKEGERWGRWGLPSYSSTWAPKPAKQVNVPFFCNKGKEQAMGAPKAGKVPSAGSCPLPRAASYTMSVTSGKTGLSLTQEILSYLGLASKVGGPLRL